MATATEPSAPDSPVVQQSSGSRGCLYGCLAVIIGGLLLLLCSGIGVYWFLKGQVEKYTSTEPMDIPMVEYSEEELAELQARVDAFSDAMDEGRTPEEDLVLTAEEINALISADEKMRGKLFITIENDQVSGDVSLPLGDFGFFEGRYFNGSGSFSVSMANDLLIVTLTDASVNGEDVPDEIVEGIGKENLAKDLYNNPDTAATLRKFESVKVEGDKLILTFKRSEEATEDGESSESSDDNASDETTTEDAGEASGESGETTSDDETTEVEVGSEGETASEEGDGNAESESATAEGSGAGV